MRLEDARKLPKYAKVRCGERVYDFGYVGQVSWTNLRWGGGDPNAPALHSGDLTDAADGASEFIDIQLDKMPSNVAYVVPTVNHYAGENYASCKECFFGFMSRDLADRGKPFEAKTVQTKFDLRGDKKVACPLVFVREGGWHVKWLDLYLKGMMLGNRVEANKYSTQLLAKSLVTRQYLMAGKLLDLYREKATRVIKSGKIPVGATYVGLLQPAGLPEKTEVYTLGNLKSLIPA